MRTKLFLRDRCMTRRLMILVLMFGFLALPARWIWTLKGGNLPSVNELQTGMTKAQVESIVGSPSFGGERPDGTSYWVITRSGSWYWVVLDFDTKGCLRSYKTECF